MSARFLAWYTFVMLALATFLLLCVSVGPDAVNFFAVLHASVAGAACLFAVFGIVLTWLPREHWCQRSLVVRGSLWMFAVVASLALLTSFA